MSGDAKRSVVTLGPALQKFIHIDPSRSINPDKDIEPTGRHEILSSDGNDALVDIYQPSGHFVGSITKHRVHILAQASSRSPQEVLMPHTQGGHPLAESLVALLGRYRNGYKEQAKSTILKNHWATPDVYIKAMQDGLSITTERFASPLKLNPTMRPSRPAYFSLYPKDAALEPIGADA